jgi:MYXO-CTERM domain-containing protein
MKNASLKNILTAALLALTVSALPALAARDTYLLGNGLDGPLVLNAGESRVVNRYARVTTALAAGAVEILVDSSAGFEPGDLVLVHQSTGLTPEPATGDISDINLSASAVGRWEFARLTADPVEAGRLKLDAALIYAYEATGAQVVKVPEYTDVQLPAGATLTADAWDGAKGGILAFLAKGNVTLTGGAALDVTGLGFRGGQYVQDMNTARRGCSSLTEAAPAGGQRGEGVARTQFGAAATGRGNVANGGGGGVCYLAGGAGGGNVGRGGDGGKTHSSADGARTVGGIGGSRVTFDPLNRMIFGGGGGAGHGIIPGNVRGGAGGGIVLIRARSLSGAEGEGVIQANGSPGPGIAANANSGAHGGGAGGSVYLRFSQLANCFVLSQGGRGGDTSLSAGFIGPGGGGGGGRLLLQSETGTCGLFPEGANAGQTPTQRPGDTVNYGATAGGPGGKTEILGDGFPETMPAPVVVTPANNSSTRSLRPTFSGTLDASFPAGSQIVLFVTMGATTVTYTLPAAASWSFTPPADMVPGNYTVLAALTKQEVWSVNSNTHAFTIDITAPAAPVITQPTEGATTSPLPVIQGTAEANTTVNVYIDGNQVGTTTATAGGTFSFPTTVPLTAGAHAVYVTSTDMAGNTSPNSNTVNFNVDAVTQTPTVQEPGNDTSTNDKTPTYSGTAEPGSTVTVIVDGAVLGTTTATPGGTWSFTQPEPGLADGPHTIQVSAVDVFGNPPATSNTNTFRVDTVIATPTVTTPANGSRTNDTTPTYTGTAEPGSTVTVIVDGTPLPTTTTADTNGNWTLTPTVPLPEGPHTVRATARDAAGNTSGSSNTNTFTVDITAPAAPVVDTPANGATISDNTPTYSGTAEPNSTVTVIVDGVPLPTTVTADGDGNWSITPTTGLSNGPHTVTATATDVAGNTGPQANTNTFTVDATIPAAPVITGPLDNTVTNDNTPAITGTAPPNSTVTVILNGNPVGNTTADAAGNWTFTPTALPDGPYVITATATSAVGNTSPPSNAVDIIIDTAAPETTIVSGPADETEDTDATFDFSSNEAGVTYECSLDGGPFQTCADPVTFENLAPGEHTLRVRARDTAGNVDPTPESYTWLVRAPTTPPVGDRDFLGDGIGCAASGGDPSSLAMMGLALLSALLGRRRRR